MVKPRDEVIAEFNEQVNMSADELERWLENDESGKAGTGVGMESGHKILAILRKNPGKVPEEYEDEDIEHMRKVVGYNKRHMAQENHLKETKTPEQLEHTKSTISLRNWGHDPMKTLDDRSNVLDNSEADSAATEDSSGDAKDTSLSQKSTPKTDTSNSDGVTHTIRKSRNTSSSKEESVSAKKEKKGSGLSNHKHSKPTKTTGSKRTHDESEEVGANKHDGQEATTLDGEVSSESESESESESDPMSGVSSAAGGDESDAIEATNEHEEEQPAKKRTRRSKDSK